MDETLNSEQWRHVFYGSIDCGECTSARSQSDRCIQSKTTWLMFIHPKFVYKQKKFPKFQSFLFFKNTPKYDKLSKISNISIKTMFELRTKFGNFRNFRHISDGLRKQYSVRTQCCNLIGSEPLYIPCNDCVVAILAFECTCGFSSRSDKCCTKVALLKTIPRLTNQHSVFVELSRLHYFVRVFREAFLGSRACLLCPTKSQNKYHLCTVDKNHVTSKSKVS